MILSSDDLPAPFSPSTPILAPGKKDREMFSSMVRLGGTVLLTPCMVNTYCATARSNLTDNRLGDAHATAPAAPDQYRNPRLQERSRHRDRSSAYSGHVDGAARES